MTNRRVIQHTPYHVDIEELRTDSDGNNVWAVIFCSEDEMNGYIDTNAEYRLNARHLKHIEATYGKDWEQVADAIHPLIVAAEAEIFTDVFADERIDNGLTDDVPYRPGNTDGEMPL
jgi:hypothetical protein